MPYNNGNPNLAKKNTYKRLSQRSPFMADKIKRQNMQNEENTNQKKATEKGKIKTEEKNLTTTAFSNKNVNLNKQPKLVQNSPQAMTKTPDNLHSKLKRKPKSQSDSSNVTPSKENNPNKASPKSVYKTPDSSIGTKRFVPANRKTPNILCLSQDKHAKKEISFNVSESTSRSGKKQKSNLQIDKISTQTDLFSSPSLKSIEKNSVKELALNFEKENRNSTKVKVRKSLYFAQQRRSLLQKRKSVNMVGTEISQIDFSVTVAVRVRPFNQREDKNKQIVFVVDQSLIVGDNEYKFDFDHSFNSLHSADKNFASQKVVYQKLADPLLVAAFEGYNTCLFAYGQTGSGKSYTVMGYDEDLGIIPRFCENMFGTIQSTTQRDCCVAFHVEMSYFEIYKEKIHDLLVSNPNSAGADTEIKKQALKVREHPEEGPYVENLSTFVVRTFADIQVWLKVGNRQRATASTGMNDKSSRSHSVFVLNMVRTTTDVLEGEEHKSSRRSRINLIDLAGSERSSTAQTSGQRLKEAACINKSLLTLGKVICALSEKSLSNKKQVFIPYRDSVLTWLLKDSLGGNARTAMIATVSPADCNLEETLSTLRYAAQARTIVNVVKINEDPNSKIIRELKAEIEKLKTKNTQNHMEEYRTTLAEVALLRDKLSGSEKERDEAESKWKRKLELSEKRKEEEIGELKRAGVSFKVDNCLPNLVNLNEDPQLSEMLLYVIKYGVTTVGKRGNMDCDIQLTGALVADKHCKIFNKKEQVTLTPIDFQNYKTYVNGNLITDSTILHHGDRVIIGGDHFFRLNQPIEVQRMGKRKSKENKDFDFAKKEWIAAQTARMEKEIQDAKMDVENQYKQTIEALIERGKVASQELEVIQEEKLMLESEVTANRKRRDMEKKLLMDAKPVLENSFSNDPLLLLVQSEKKKIQEDIEKLQKNLDNQIDLPVVLNNSRGSDFLKLTTLINEANNISKDLKRFTDFSVYNVDNSDHPEVKVVNTKMRVWTLWSMEKFQEKLELIRDAYDGIMSGKDVLDTNVDYLFYDAKELWNEVMDNNVKTKSTPQHTRRSIRRISSLLVKRASPAHEVSPQHHTNSTNSTIELCRNLIQDSMDAEPLLESSFDFMLESINIICTQAINLFNLFKSDESHSLETSNASESVLKLSMALNCVKSAVQIFYFEKKSERMKICKTVSQANHQLKDETRQIAFATAKLLHGFENDLDTVVQDSLDLLKKHIANFSKCLGAISLSSKCLVSFISQPSVQTKIKEAFMQGSDVYLTKTLRNKIQKLSNMASGCEQQEIDLKSAFENTKSLLSAVLKFEEQAKEKSVQNILNQTFCASQTIEANDLGISLETYYSSNYSYKTAIMKTTSDLVRNILSMKSLCLEANMIEQIQKTVFEITELCGCHESFCNDLHETLKKSSYSSQSFDEVEYSNTAADDVCSTGMDLCECLDKMLNTMQANSETSSKNATFSSTNFTMSNSDVLNNNKGVGQSSITTGTTNVISSTVLKWIGISDRGSVVK